MSKTLEIWIGQERIRIGRAKRNCRCDECRENIQKGEPRITLFGHFFTHRCDRHYHIDCKIDFIVNAKEELDKALLYIKKMFAYS